MNQLYRLLWCFIYTHMDKKAIRNHRRLLYIIFCVKVLNQLITRFELLIFKIACLKCMWWQPCEYKFETMEGVSWSPNNVYVSSRLYSLTWFRCKKSRHHTLRFLRSLMPFLNLKVQIISDWAFLDWIWAQTHSNFKTNIKYYCKDTEPLYHCFMYSLS